MECWTDPYSLAGQKALETIGRNLQLQYEMWQPRARYRLSLDPSIEETKKLCSSLRRNAKEERILFHYNGHGVPKPTPGGELWVFNKNYTQYIPVSIYDLQTWLGSPCIYVYDCSCAGNILLAFNKFAQQRDQEMLRQNQHNMMHSGEPAANVPPYVPLSQCIQIAACRPNEVLPMSPELPADLLTCCLTTPIEIALKFIILHNPLIKNVTHDMILKVPGKLNDRRTPLGELNWIFTAITDTIAWNVLPPDMFQRLFRQDLMVAALFRNFLLADRIMRCYNCHPMSSPVLPQTHQHPMWECWDLAADACLSQLPALLDPKLEKPVEYKHSNFFSEQLSAFEVWLKKGRITQRPPEQLPIVLQVLLSQVHRLRALMLLSKFLDMDQKAIHLALSVGIFPYVLKLLQSPASELRPVLVFIWAKLLAVDSSCQTDLLKDNGYTYFIGILSMSDSNMGTIANPSEHRAMCAFVLTVFCRDFASGQHACFKHGLLNAVATHIKDADPLLRQWVCICLSQLWNNYPDCKWAAVNIGIEHSLSQLLQDPVTEVRAAALMAYGTLLGDLSKSEQGIRLEQNTLASVLKSVSDASPMVRRELVVVLSKSVQDNPQRYVSTAKELMEEERSQTSSTVDERKMRRYTMQSMNERIKFAESKAPVQKSIYNMVWKALLVLSVDSYKHVASLSCAVVDKIVYKVLANSGEPLRPVEVLEQPQAAPVAPAIVDIVQPTLRRSTSLVNSLRNIAFMVGLSTESLNEPRQERPRSMVDSLRVNQPSSTGSVETLNDDGAIALNSDFYEWSCDYFREPQMATSEIDDPGSIKFNERQWRKQRKARMMQDTEPLYPDAGSVSFEKFQGMMLNDVGCKRNLVCHPYDPYLVCSDDRYISVFDTDQKQRTLRFSNNNPKGSSITSLLFVNDEDASLLLAGSDEGIVRVYRNYSKENIELVTTWRSFTEISPLAKGTGMVCEWHQGRGALFTGGCTDVIRVWDAEEEVCIQNISLNHNKLVSTMKVDQLSGTQLLAGFMDGFVKMYDVRVPQSERVVAEFSAGHNRILSANYLGQRQHEFVTGSLNGQIMLWDIRQKGCTLRIDPEIEGGMTHFDMHPSAPLLSCGSKTMNVRVMNLMGENLGNLKYNEGFLPSKATPILGLTFHPVKLDLYLNTGSTIYSYASNIQPSQMFK
ncbi:raptor N-terminal caspase like domain-containing protein [Gorgonomyces haynaldii]|nr:raptor N-terminal caspase like domain-containing protein [Gorgonomyces haynaldii]